MSTHRLCRFLSTLILGLGLAALPFAVSLDGLDDQPAFAKNGGNGGGNGGGKGGGRGGGHGNGKGGGQGHANDGGSRGTGHNSPGQHGAASSVASANSDDRPGKALGHVKKDAALADATAGNVEVDTPHPSSLGRLNGFMNASPEALANAAPNSAIGVVAQDYREALATYADSIAAAPEGAVVVDPALDAAAKALALAANKALTPDIVAAVNAHLAETYADDPALAGFADPESAESVDAAEAIAAQAEGYQEREASEGLGFASPEGAGDVSGEETQAVVIE
jgi:hypothetical protein